MASIGCPSQEKKAERVALAKHIRFPSDDDEPAAKRVAADPDALDAPDAPPGEPPMEAAGETFAMDDLSTEVFAAVPELKRVLDRLHRQPASIEAKLGTLLNRFHQLETESGRLLTCGRRSWSWSWWRR